MCVIDKGVQVSGERDAGTCSAEAAQLVTVTVRLHKRTIIQQSMMNRGFKKCNIDLHCFPF